MERHIDLESETWQVFGYKSGKGKKPRNMGKLYFGEMLDKDRALKAAQNIFCFSTVTDVRATKYTKLDVFIERLQGTKWLWIPAILVISGIILSTHFHIVWPAIVMVFIGITFGVIFAPRTPV